MHRAWGDESIRTAQIPPRYYLAASFYPSTPHNELDQLIRIKPKNAEKLHWMDMNRHLRMNSIRALSDIGMLHTVVVGVGLRGRKQERARRKCLEVLLPLLEARGIEHLTLESRGNFNDKKDVDMLINLRRSGALSFIDLDHAKGKDDPHLWVPDQLLGAFGDRERLSETPGLAKLFASVEAVEINL